MSRYRNIIATLIGFQTTVIWIYVVTYVIKYQRMFSRDDLNLYSNKLKYNKYNVSKDKKLTKLNSTDRTKFKNSNVSHVGGECTDIVLPVDLLQVDSWSRVDNKSVYVFAAYNVESDGKIMAVGASVKPAPDVFCQLWHIADDNITVTLHVRKAVIRLHPEDHGRM